MANLTKNRTTAELASGGKQLSDPVAADTKIFLGAMVGLDAAGNAVPAAPATPVMRGVASAEADNTDGAAGAIAASTKRGTFLFNQTGLDRTDIGSDVYVADDNTVAATGTLVAGKLIQIEAAGAWVEIL
ncbi:hypothetical protein BOO69_09655 [Sulfitobacter alexandrii]|uniref:DUF2190 family protein n=1 Tax=Sulfitobacter alexandrii TaxID=1917485 RepID=A0A1J0WH71_9RHOB|nr:hypothetical protein [Sulfitobacter alexandrii]APE43650.1 hypothetical protein BOO69_09655 [Sulfitobacter alexandrii]